MVSAVLDPKPISGLMGAEVSGVDVKDMMTPGGVAELKALIDKAGVLVLRDQKLDPEGLVAFTNQMGRPLQLPYVEPMEGHPEVIAVLKEVEERKVSVFGEDWHSDYSFLAQPPSYTVLYGVEIPPVGGDTVFTDMRLGYETLSDGMRATLDRLNAMHSGHVYGAKNLPAKTMNTSRSIKISRNNPEADEERPHPVVRHRPGGDRPALFVNKIYTTRFENMTKEESAPILNQLYSHVTRPEFGCRWRWRQGDLLLWDNRIVMHYAVNDYDGHHRLLWRTTTEGETPVGA